jgi:hypothetical protein
MYIKDKQNYNKIEKTKKQQQQQQQQSNFLTHYFFFSLEKKINLFIRLFNN